MKRQLLKILYALFNMLIMASTTANAQIVYTNLNPDSNLYFNGCPTYPCTVPCDICVGPHYFDLNNDATNEFEINIYQSGSSTSCNGFPAVSWSHSIEAFFYTSAVVSMDSVSVYEFNLSDTIGSQQSWIDSAGLIIKKYTLVNPGSVCSVAVYGNWNTTGFLGINFTIGNQSHFGWVRAYVNAGSSFFSPISFILYDFAYNSIPNQYILAGDTGLGSIGITENITSIQMSLYPNPAHNYFTIASNKNMKNAIVTVTDIFGNTLISTISREMHKFDVNTTNFAAGIYFVQIQNSENLVTRKLMIE